MPVWTGPIDIVQVLVNRFCAVVPPEIANPSRSDNQDDIYALAEQMACAEGMAQWLTREMEPAHADASFLTAHARAVGLGRQGGEPDPSLLARIRTPPLAVTKDLIIQALQQIVNAAGSTLPVFLVELPKQSAYVGYSYIGMGARVGQTRPPIVIALIPAAAASATRAVLAALQAKVAASKTVSVETYTG